MLKNLKKSLLVFSFVIPLGYNTGYIHADLGTGASALSCKTFGGVKDYFYSKPASGKSGFAEKAAQLKEKAANLTKVGFIITNKSPNNIKVTLYNHSVSKLGVYTDEIAPKETLSVEEDISVPTFVKIVDAKANKTNFYDITAQDKTIYVHWDGTRLYPQKGPLNGLLGVTDNCYNLKNNVKTNDIKKLTEQEAQTKIKNFNK